jgi:argininosuccinate lyase
MLGFPGLIEVAYDAVSSRDDMLEAVAAAAVLMTGLSRLATDLQTWNTMEFGFIELADAYSATSSIMPQKKNPQAMEYVKSAAANVTGALTTVLACAKNTALADVNDGVTAVNVPGVEAIQRVRNALAVMDGVLATLTVRPEVMRHSAEIGFGSATELADVIVRETGMSFRKAHNIVGRVVREAIEAVKPATAITSADLDRAGEALFGAAIGLSPRAVTNALDPDANIRGRTSIGGPAPETVQAMIEVRRSKLGVDAAGLTDIAKRIETATHRLMQRARQASAAVR